jgi:hypothetical protein
MRFFFFFSIWYWIFVVGWFVLGVLVIEFAHAGL